MTEGQSYSISTTAVDLTQWCSWTDLSVNFITGNWGKLILAMWSYPRFWQPVRYVKTVMLQWVPITGRYITVKQLCTMSC